MGTEVGTATAGTTETVVGGEATATGVTGMTGEATTGIVGTEPIFVSVDIASDLVNTHFYSTQIFN